MKDVVAELRVGVKDLAAEDRNGWSPLGLSDRVRDLVGLSEVMQVELVRGLAGWDRAAALGPAGRFVENHHVQIIGHGDNPASVTDG